MVSDTFLVKKIKQNSLKLKTLAIFVCKQITPEIILQDFGLPLFSGKMTQCTSSFGRFGCPQTANCPFLFLSMSTDMYRFSSKQGVLYSDSQIQGINLLISFLKQQIESEHLISTIGLKHFYQVWTVMRM